MIYERKFKCDIDGWKSQAFGNRGYIDPKRLPLASSELDQHYKEKHPEANLHPDGTWKFSITFDKIVVSKTSRSEKP